VQGGLDEGDTVLRYPGSTLREGRAAQVVDGPQAEATTAED
jgi:hypothetical protein